MRSIGRAAGATEISRGARRNAAANVRIAGESYTLDSGPEDTHVTFKIRLEAGQARLETAFLDARGGTLCSAIYVKLTRLPDTDKRELTPPSS